MEFIENAHEWMDKDESRIMAIHCKGGKGRTGTVVCSWLLEDEKFRNAKVSNIYLLCWHVTDR